MKICSNTKHILFLSWYWNLILIQSEFYNSAAVTHEFKKDVQKIVGASLRYVPSRVKWSQKNPQATDWERCLGKIELDNLGKENEGKSNNSGTQ